MVCRRKRFDVNCRVRPLSCSLLGYWLTDTIILIHSLLFFWFSDYQKTTQTFLVKLFILRGKRSFDILRWYFGRIFKRGIWNKCSLNSVSSSRHFIQIQLDGLTFFVYREDVFAGLWPPPHDEITLMIVPIQVMLIIIFLVLVGFAVWLLKRIFSETPSIRTFLIQQSGTHRISEYQPHALALLGSWKTSPWVFFWPHYAIVLALHIDCIYLDEWVFFYNKNLNLLWKKITWRQQIFRDAIIFTYEPSPWFRNCVVI